MNKTILAMTVDYIAMKTWDNGVRFLEESVDDFPKEHQAAVKVAIGKAREAIRLLQPVLESLLEQANGSKKTVLKLIKDVSEGHDGENPNGN